MNQVNLIGRITRDPEIRYTPNNVGTVSFSLAVERHFKNAGGEKEADFIGCVAWKAQAEFISKYVKKGDKLGIEGRIQTRTYQDSSNQTRYITEVVVSSVENLTPREQQPKQQTTFNVPIQPVQQVQQKETFGVEVEDNDLPF